MSMTVGDALVVILTIIGAFTILPWYIDWMRRRLSHLEADALKPAIPPEIQVSHSGEASSSSEVIPGIIAERTFMDEEAMLPTPDEREWDVERRAENLLRHHEDI